MPQQMSMLLALIILTSSETIASVLPPIGFIPDNECVNYTTLGEATRSRFFSNQSTAFSDRYLTGWFALNGSAGTQIATTCVASEHCGTIAPGWMPGGHPRAEEGVVKRFVCFSYKQLCCGDSGTLRVRNCGGFFVYKLDSMPSFNVSFRVCGAGIEELPPLVEGRSNETSGNTPDECLNFNRLDERDRAADYFSYHTLKCDANLPQTWYRFTGRAGTGMPSQCVPKLHCGTLSPGWLNGNHPTVGEGVVERMVCFTKDDNCCFWYSRVKVRNCGEFVVYKFGQFPTLQHFCSLRYCGAGYTGCKDKNGNVYEVRQTWKPNPLITCECRPDFEVLCSKTQNGCWDKHGNAFVNKQEWLSNSITKCVCSNGKINCTKLSRPACTDENGNVKKHGTNWFPGACFNCSCTDGVISCIKHHVTIHYGLLRVEAVGSCLPCRQPRYDIKPAGNGTVSNCQVFFQLKNSNKLFHCANGAFIRKHHVCNGISECPDGSDEAGCHDVICRDDDGQVLILKEDWKVSECLECKCIAGLLKCERRLQVNFPGLHDGYALLPETCEQPACNTAEFIKDRRQTCEAIETTMGGRILLEGETWEHQGCKFKFTAERRSRGCPNMIGPGCDVYNGAVCCANRCPALAELASQMRWNVSMCPGGLQLKADDDTCDIPKPNCLPDNDFCKTNVTCRDEEATSYFEGATWTVSDCIKCGCNKGLISCAKKMSFITSNDEYNEDCSQPTCNVVAFLKSNQGICKACRWKNKTLQDGYRWTENGVDFFCDSNQRVRPGCYLGAKKITCTGAFTGIQNLSLISAEQLFLCESGDEIRSLNDRCNKVNDCNDHSDEKDCAQYFCPSHTKFNLYWKRTLMDEIVYQNCSEVDPDLGGHFGGQCKLSSPTYWKYKETCDCEKETLLQKFREKLSSVNLSNLVETTRELRSEAVNFTNKNLLFGYLNALFYTGARLLTPIGKQNDIETLNFSRTLISTAGDHRIFKPPSDSFCPQKVSTRERNLFRRRVKKFSCQAPNVTRTFAFCRRPLRIFWDRYARPVSYNTASFQYRPGMTQFWLRPLVRLKIDPSRLSPDSSSLLQRNKTGRVNGSDVLRQANCSWVEYDVNGTLKVRATEVKDDEKEERASIQGYLELVLSSISIVAVIISLVILSCLRIRSSERIFVHKNLLLSLCLVYIVMIFDTFVFTNRKHTTKLCSSMAVIQHFTHIAIFSWMLVEGIHLYIKLVKVFSVTKLYITYVIIGWGLPAVIVGLIGVIRPQTYDMSKTYYKDVMCGSLNFKAEIIRDRCWLHDGEWLYKGPILAILLVNVAIFAVLLRVIFTKISIKYQTDNIQKAKRGLKSVATLLPLLGVTWLLGFVVHLSEVLLYLFIILNSTQGLLFCIFHSLLDDQIKESLFRSFRRSRMKHLRNERTSVASTTTQLSPTGSLTGKEQVKQRQSIQTSEANPDETEI